MQWIFNCADNYIIYWIIIQILSIISIFFCGFQIEYTILFKKHAEFILGVIASYIIAIIISYMLLMATIIELAKYIKGLK